MPRSAAVICGVAAMEKHIALPLRKLTKRVTGSGKKPKTPPRPSTPKMAEQEEDFSSLPLPDRFQHKVPIMPQAPKLPRANGLIIFRSRYGKYEKQPMKMLRSNSRLHLTNRTRPSDHSYKNLVCGRELLQTRTLPHSRMVLRHYVPSSNLVVAKGAQGVLSVDIEEEVDSDIEL